MSLILTAVVIIGTIAVLNLCLTLAVIRRMRGAADRGPEPISGLAPGTPLPEFSAETLSGGLVTSTDLRGEAAVFAFLSTTCPACKPAIPDLVRYVGLNGLEPSQVVAVVSGDRDDARDIASMLADVATVIVEAPKGPLVSAFSVSGSPTFTFVKSDGTVSRSRVGGGDLVSAV